jgi:hypothetical protein
MKHILAVHKFCEHCNGRDSGVVKVWQSVALATPTSTRLLDNLLLSLCEQYKIKYLLSFATFQYTSATPIFMGWLRPW